MRLAHFPDAPHAGTGLLAMRAREDLAGPTVRAMVRALNDLGACRDGFDPRIEADYDLAEPLRVGGLAWAVPGDEATAQVQRAGLLEIGARFGLEHMSCLYAAPDRPVLRGPTADPLPGESEVPFPVSGYPEIFKKFHPDGFGINLKLGPAGSAPVPGEGQLLSVFMAFWLKPYVDRYAMKAGHLPYGNMYFDYSPTVRCASWRVDRFRPLAPKLMIPHLLWVAARLHEMLPLRYAGFGDTQPLDHHPLSQFASSAFLGGNPLRRIYRAEGEDVALEWGSTQSLWDVWEQSSMLTALATDHDRDDPAGREAAIRLCRHALRLAPDNASAASCLVSVLVRHGDRAEAARFVGSYGSSELGLELLEQLADESPP